VDKVNRFPNKITEIIISAQRTSTRHVDHLPIQASISFNIKMEKKSLHQSVKECFLNLPYEA
jgi:hypothetical protein